MTASVSPSRWPCNVQPAGPCAIELFGMQSGVARGAEPLGDPRQTPDTEAGAQRITQHPCGEHGPGPVTAPPSSAALPPPRNCALPCSACSPPGAFCGLEHDEQGGVRRPAR